MTDQQLRKARELLADAADLDLARSRAGEVANLLGELWHQEYRAWLEAFNAPRK